MQILNVGYRSVNCYLLVTEKAKLLIDVGWPGGMPEFKSAMAAQGYSVKEVTHILVTHYHVDHGGIAQEMKDKSARLIVMESQRGHLNDQKRYVRPPLVFHIIRIDDNIELSFRESRVFLKELGVNGEIISTPSHSPDHVTLVTDEGEAFTGDFPPESGYPEDTDVFGEWQRLHSMRVKRIYPAHGPPRE